MKKRTKPAKKSSAPLTSELLLLPDGRILAHNLTPAFADILAGLTANDELIMSRVTRHSPPSRELGRAALPRVQADRQVGPAGSMVRMHNSGIIKMSHELPD